MLQRDVEVVADLRDGRHRLHQRRRDEAGVGVHQPDPGQAGRLAREAFEQPRQPFPQTDVLAVGGGVLRDEHQLPDPRIGEPPRFQDQRVDGGAAEGAPLDAGDVAERAGARAAVGDLEVGAGPRRDAGRPRLRDVPRRAGPQRFDDRVPGLDAERRVDAGVLAADARRLDLGPAADDQQPLIGALVALEARDGVGRLLLGRVDEAAGVDDQHLGGVGRVGAMAGAAERAHQLLGIGRVFGAAQGPQVVAHHSVPASAGPVPDGPVPAPASASAGGGAVGAGPRLTTTVTAVPESSVVPGAGS